MGEWWRKNVGVAHFMAILILAHNYPGSRLVAPALLENPKYSGRYEPAESAIMRIAPHFMAVVDR